MSRDLTYLKILLHFRGSDSGIHECVRSIWQRRLILNVLASQSLGIFVSAVFLHVKEAQVVGSVWILASMLVGGYYIDNQNVPEFLKPFRWLSYLKVGL